MKQIIKKLLKKLLAPIVKELMQENEKFKKEAFNNESLSVFCQKVQQRLYDSLCQI